uniref:DNA-binding protein RFX2 n=1 Tax=Xiphophorus couchianus TaxID=32473 RepID=A0A3B5LL91_9TELE
MQNSEAASDPPTGVATLRTSSSAQAPVVQPVPASQQQVQHVYPTQVQYVGESGEAVYTNGTRTAYSYNPDSQLYGQGSGGAYFDSQAGGTHVTTVVSSASSGVPPHGMVGIAMDVGSSHIISSGSTYLLHSGGMEGNRSHISHSSRSSSAMLEMAIENLQKSEGIASHKSSLLNSHLQWLLDNYETAEGVSLPRCSLYNHYLRHCQEQKLDPVNAASFGKLIRSVFMGLRTRRLGTGNSKYHYYGIRVKPDSPLNRLQEDTQYMAMRQQPVHQKQFKPLQKVDSMSDSLCGSSQHCSSTPEQSVAAQTQQHQQYITSHSLPPFPSPDLGTQPLPERISMTDIKKLQTLYRSHCELLQATLDVVMNLQFHYVENFWQNFWNATAPSSDGSTTVPSDDELERVIPREKLVSLCKYEPVRLWMRSCDHILYQALVEILIPDVLRPVPTLTQAIRNFAKSLEGWLTTAMTSFPQEIVRTKVAVVSAFAQTLRRYTSLNHLAQAARAVLQNTSQINQMLSDLNRVDFANEQASWVCQCDEGVVQRLEQDFKVTLQQQSSLDQWATWLDNVVSQVLKPHQGSPSFPKAARQFLLKWSFYSMVIRDLTLRSAASFGSFHLIRLLYDEYMFYLVEHRVAQATGETPIAVMGEFSDLSSMMPSLLEKASFSDEMSNLDGDGAPAEPAVKRERIEIGHPLQEM